jgi:Bardet-Biedl syndrome 4 protein
MYPDPLSPPLTTARPTQDFEAALKVIDEQLSTGPAEYPLYVKALIKRQQGEIQASLQLFQAATVLNPHNLANLKQVGRSLYLLGKHKAANDVYEEAQRIGAWKTSSGRVKMDRPPRAFVG